MDLNTYLSKPGSLTVAALAKAADIKHVAQINQWRNPSQNRRPDHKYAAALEWATQGQCTCEELNPNLPWARIPDPEWPWHPGGRPVVDPTSVLEVMADRDAGKRGAPVTQEG